MKVLRIRNSSTYTKPMASHTLGKLVGSQWSLLHISSEQASGRRHSCHPESTMSCQKSDSVNRWVFASRTILPNFTPIWPEIRVRTILVLGYWVLGNIHRYWIVLLLGDIFCCSDTQYNTNQTAVSTTVHMPVCSTCDFYSDRRNHRHCHRVLVFFCGHCYAIH